MKDPPRYNDPIIGTVVCVCGDGTTRILQITGQLGKLLDAGLVKIEEKK